MGCHETFNNSVNSAVLHAEDLFSRITATQTPPDLITKLLPEILPVIDRAALVNYATFLAWERNRVCAELYPHLGTRAAGFVLGMNAADRFFHRSDVDSRDPPGRAPASARAVAVLDLVGVDWRSDPPGDGLERSIGLSECADTGERPAVPYGWPAIDAALTSALAELRMIDAAMAALMQGHDREANDVPCYSDLDDAREAAIDVLEMKAAQGMIGLRAKAAALQVRTITESSDQADRIAQSLARDLLAIDGRAIAPQSDPIFAAIAEGKRLLQISAEVYRLPDIGRDPLPEKEAASDALSAHVYGVLLKTVPTTAAGCAALIKFAQTYHESEGISLCEGNEDLVSLIARSPAL